MPPRKKKNNAKSKAKPKPKPKTKIELEPETEPELEPAPVKETYYVERIERKRIHESRTYCEWEFKWKGWDKPKDKTWEPAENFFNTSFDKLKDFENKLKDLKPPNDPKKLDLRKNFFKLDTVELERVKDAKLKELKATEFEIVQYSPQKNVFLIRLLSNGQLWAVNRKNVQDNFKDNYPVIDMFCEFTRRSLVNTRIDLRDILKEPGRQLDGDKLWIDFPRVVDSTNPSPSNAVVLDGQIPGTSKQQPMDQS